MTPPKVYPPMFLAAALALSGCGGREAGAMLGGTGFGQSHAAILAVQTGQAGPMQDLAQRFAREVPDTVTFAFDSAVLEPEARAILDRQADWIRQFPEVRFRVYGHTDLVGSAAYNHQLGQRRAEAVVAYLVGRGVSRDRLEALVSQGQTRPVVLTPGPERRNRRTVTEVSGFVQRHPMVMDAQYAEIVRRSYIESAERPLPPISETRRAF